MAYSLKAIEIRRCQAVRQDGERCLAWAIWGDADQFCASHTRTPALRRVRRTGYVQRARYSVCRCEAYQWPHRPGGGLCRWPDPPECRCTISAGTRAEWR
jgi:hypothetical protein